MVGNIGREQGTLKHSVIVSYLTYPLKYFIEDDKTHNNVMGIFTAIAFNIYSKEWRKKPPMDGAIKRGATISFYACIYLLALSSSFVFNVKVENEYGEDVRVLDIIKNILKSPYWAEFRNNVWHTIEFAWKYGISQTIQHLKHSMDIYGEMNAYKVSFRKFKQYFLY